MALSGIIDGVFKLFRKRYVPEYDENNKRILVCNHCHTTLNDECFYDEENRFVYDRQDCVLSSVFIDKSKACFVTEMRTLEDIKELYQHNKVHQPKKGERPDTVAYIEE